MGKYFFSVIFFAMCVNLYLSQETLEMSDDQPFGKLKPFNMDDFSKPPVIEPRNCYHPFINCLKKLKVRQTICALHKDQGLLTMATACDVYFQNCLVHTEEDVGFGKTSEEDIFYFNGKEHNCLYYFKNTKNLTEASILYVQGWIRDVSGNEVSGTETATE